MKIGLIGYGEAGSAIAHSLKSVNTDSEISAYDKAMPAKTNLEATLLDDVQALAQKTDILISVVTADECVNAAKQIAPYLKAHHIYLDGNSVSPGTKRQAASFISANGANYVDMAIMAPIQPRGHQTPLLFAGHCDDRLSEFLAAFAFSYQWEDQLIGQASVVKMLRSILIKGMECLITESVTASQGLGLDTRILQSAGRTLGIADMEKLADYVMERTATHGRRRAAEMREVSKTLAELGLSHDMSDAIAVMQDRIADMKLGQSFAGQIPQDRHQLAPAMRKAQKIS